MAIMPVGCHGVVRGPSGWESNQVWVIEDGRNHDEFGLGTATAVLSV
ncbi:MAG: hypothetical protein ACJAZD_003102, partial [Ilumatobacter sp.]